MTTEKQNKKLQTQFEVPKELVQEVNTWKGKYKKVKYLDVGSEITTKDHKDKRAIVKYIPGSVVFFRMPTRQEMSAAENLAIDEAGQLDTYKKAEKMMVDCYLGGQITLEAILEDIEIYMAVAEYCLYNLVQAKKKNWGSC